MKWRRNSFWVASLNVILALVLSVPAAYARARWRSSASEHLSFWILSIRMAPAFGIVVPMFILMREARLLDSPFAVITAIAGTMRFDWPLMSALSSLSLVPAFILVASLQRHIVRGLTMGAVR